MPVLKLWHHFIAIIENSTTYCGSPAGYVHPKNLAIQIVFMQRQFHWRRIKKVTALMLPIIDLQPLDPTCSYSALKFVARQVKLLAIKAPYSTFYLPSTLVQGYCNYTEKKLNIVCRLGGFHLLMSFLGSIGTLMKGSGIEELQGEIYATNVI